MLCISLGEKTVSGTIISLKDLSFAEIRMDKIEDLDIKGLEKIFSVKTPLIATFRKGSATQKNRENFLIKAIEMGAAYIDIDINSDVKFKNKIINKAEEYNTKTIISYHNFEFTPSYNELIEIYENIKKAGADTVKIACKINIQSDNIKLIRLMEQKDCISIGMGTKGKITRLAGFYLGSPFTYASLTKKQETAGGQIPQHTLLKIIEGMNE